MKLFLHLLCAMLWLGVRPSSVGAQPADDPVVATVNETRRIRLREVDLATGGEIQKYEQQIFRLRRRAVENLIDRAILEDEAARLGIDAGELIRRLLPTEITLDSKQLEKAQAEYLPALRHMGEVEARLRVRLDLETYERIARFKAAIDDLRNRAKIRIHLPEPPVPRLSAAETGPALGPAAANVQLIVYSDYQCPYCRSSAGWARRIAAAYPGRVRVVLKHFPLQIHPQAFLAARAANCADRQGRFWEYHERLFAVNDLSEPMLLRYAVDLGMDELDFEQCLESDASRDAVLADIQEARSFSLPGTPSYILNGKQISIQTFDQLNRAVEREIAGAAKGGISQ